jgi:hypothetical protein
MHSTVARAGSHAPGAAPEPASSQPLAASQEWVQLPQVIPEGHPASFTSNASSTTAQQPPVPDANAPLQFKRVALGGTFDRLHCGHELLLGTAALVTTQKAYVGITGETGTATSTRAQPVQQRHHSLPQHPLHATVL